MKLVVLVAVTLFSGTAVQAQTIYVWNSTGSPDPLVGYDGTIVKISEGQETTLANTGPNFNGAVGLAVDSNGFLYSGNPSNSTVTQYAAGGVSTSVGGFDSISGLTFSNGQLYGTSPNYNEIVGGAHFSQSTSGSAKLNFPFNIAINSQGNIFAANAGGSPIGFYGGSNSYANTIEEFSPTFADLNTFASNLNEPYGVAFSAGDFLFVSNLGNNTIDVFTPSGAEQVYATAAQGLNKPAGLAFDSQGNLYVANEGNGTVEELFADGSHVTIARGLANPVSIAISDLPLAAAPEPQSWLLGALAVTVFAAIARANRAYPATRHRSPC